MSSVIVASLPTCPPRSHAGRRLAPGGHPFHAPRSNPQFSIQKMHPVDYINPADVGTTLTSESTPLVYSMSVVSETTARFPDAGVHSSSDDIVNLGGSAVEIEVENNQDQPATVELYKSHFATGADQLAEPPAELLRSSRHRNTELEGGETHTFTVSGWRFAAVDVTFESVPAGNNNTTVTYRLA